MVHNGIEYGVMAAYAEGLNILKNANAGTVQREADAETAPLEHPEYYQYEIDIATVAEVWRRGSVIASWLLDLTAAALLASPDLHEYSGRVSDSGEGRWTAIAAIEEGVPAPVLLTALASRFSSRGLDHFADQTLSAMRKQFGGHDGETGRMSETTRIAVLFDIDGTLLITGGAGAASWRLAFDELYGIPADIGEVHRHRHDRPRRRPQDLRGGAEPQARTQRVHPAARAAALLPAPDGRGVRSTTGSWRAWRNSCRS